MPIWTPALRAKMSAIKKAQMADPIARMKQSAKQKERLADHELAFRLSILLRGDTK
jgi:hypothetical protein